MQTISPLWQNRAALEARLKELPMEPGVYLMKDRTDAILYVGKSKRLRSRVRSYFRFSSDLTPRIQRMVVQVCEIEFIVTDTEAEALALEDNLIKANQPPYNVLLKDDKKYPYLCMTWSEDYPQLFITRNRRWKSRQTKGDRARTDRYYGPYTDVRLLRHTLGLVKRIFPLRQRWKPLHKDRPCLNYDIGRCPGVCQGLIDPMSYRQTLQQVAMIFQGQAETLMGELSQRMLTAAEAENYEAAARLRDQVKGLQQLGETQKVSLPNSTVSRDAIALAADERHACIQLFQVRSGKLVGRLAFVAERACNRSALENKTEETSETVAVLGNSENVPAAEADDSDLPLILQRALEAHYRNCDPVEIAPEILTQFPLPDADFIESWLSEAKRRKVTLIAPQRQSKAELLEMVERNAQYELDRAQRSADRNAMALKRLSEVLDLPGLPHRIEGYDISHIQGSDAVGSRVVFIDGLPAKQHYRRYKIRNPDIHSGRSDDFASHAEVAKRRFGNMSASDTPDLVVIDGGKGQLSAVRSELDRLGLDHLPLISLAKRREEIFLPGRSIAIQLDDDDPGRLLLQRLRDEAHRFAITFHRQQRRVRQQHSTLDDIPGLGKHRQKLLLAEFRSISRIQTATPTELAQVSGIGPKLAQQIHAYFHPDAAG
ncbi:MAG: excinuclease ABC subunit UvrC [Cyanobacteria bacterium P01_E01_bin.48]